MWRSYSGEGSEQKKAQRVEKLDAIGFFGLMLAVDVERNDGGGGKTVRESELPVQKRKA